MHLPSPGAPPPSPERPRPGRTLPRARAATDSLQQFLGPTRTCAALLTALESSAGTGALADVLNLGPATVSCHLGGSCSGRVW
ncbi:hypothetical protein [Kitasatospora viridis]|uniref:Uncharacterized protein n=1 Tax=Kitasatospora viridis TaxID=281105 RepID=A0A561SEU1_9ACTN|nr:hypothetical protein [Kitasatospora viridis]TWF73379.1 hypothetical protein FHX73_16530 [Kitasatospora viridis]